jgi:hypothetical protein
VGPRADLDVDEERSSQSLPGFEPPIIQPVAQRYTTELPRPSLITKYNFKTFLCQYVSMVKNLSIFEQPQTPVTTEDVSLTDCQKIN